MYLCRVTVTIWQHNKVEWGGISQPLHWSILMILLIILNIVLNNFRTLCIVWSQSKVEVKEMCLETFPSATWHLVSCKLLTGSYLKRYLSCVIVIVNVF